MERRKWNSNIISLRKISKLHYGKDNMTVESPNGTMADLDTKYCFYNFRTEERAS